jgi:hypothetical protein
MVSAGAPESVASRAPSAQRTPAQTSLAHRGSTGSARLPWSALGPMAALIAANVALGACKTETASPIDLRLVLDPGPRLVQVAAMMPGSAPSDRLTAAITLARGLKDHLPMRSGKASDHIDVRALPPEAAQALDLTFMALEAGETLPRAGCSDGVEEALTLGQLLDLTAPAGDVAQLDAVMWLGTRLREDRPGALGTVAGMTLAANTVKLAEARGLKPWAGIERHWVPPHFTLIAYARESICALDRLHAAGTDHDLVANGLLARDGKALRQQRDDTVRDGLELVRDPALMVRRLAESEEQALKSSHELVRLQALGPQPWRDVEEARKVIDDYVQEARALAIASRSKSDAARAAPDAKGGQMRAALLAALGDALWLGREGGSARILGLTAGARLHALGFRNGDLVTTVASVPVGTVDALKKAITEAPEGVAQIAVLRRGESLTLRFELEWTQTAGAGEAGDDDPLPRFEGITPAGSNIFIIGLSTAAPKVIDMLEYPTEFRLVPIIARGGKGGKGGLAALQLFGVRKQSLAAALGLRSGDVLSTYNGKPIEQEFLRRSFKTELRPSTITLGLTRKGVARTLTWELR